MINIFKWLPVKKKKCTLCGSKQIRKVQKAFMCKKCYAVAAPFSESFVSVIDAHSTSPGVKARGIRL